MNAPKVFIQFSGTGTNGGYGSTESLEMVEWHADMLHAEFVIEKSPDGLDGVSYTVHMHSGRATKSKPGDLSHTSYGQVVEKDIPRMRELRASALLAIATRGGSR